MEWKHTDSPVNKKFWVQWSVKKVMLTVLWNVKGPIAIHFLEKDVTVNWLPIANFVGKIHLIY